MNHPAKLSLSDRILLLLADHFGFDPDTLSLESDLVEDIDLKGDLEGLARFVQTVNTEFDTDIKVPHIIAELNAENLHHVADLVSLVEDAQLE